MDTTQRKLTVRCSSDVAQAFIGFAKDATLDYGPALEVLLHTALAIKEQPVEMTETDLLRLLGCTVEEVALIEEACLQPGVDFWTLVRIGVLAQAKRTNSGSLERRKEALANPPKEGVRAYGKGYFLVQNAVERLMQSNQQAATTWDIVYLSKVGLVEASGTNIVTVNRYLTLHQGEIDEHNAAMGFTSLQAGMIHNRRRAVHFGIRKEVVTEATCLLGEKSGQTLADIEDNA